MDIILARPHALLRDAVSAALERSGFTVRVVRSADEISRVNASGAGGAIVSAAATSDVGASLPEMLETFRAEQPNLPLIITTLMDSKSISSLEKVVQEAYGECELVSMESEVRATAPCDNRPRHILLLTRFDLEDKSGVDAALRKHFSSLIRTRFGARLDGCFRV